MANRVVLSLLLFFVVVVGAPRLFGQQESGTGKRSVWIYLYRSEDEDVETAEGRTSQRAVRENVMTLVRVRRQVSAVTPARGALEAIIAGPTDSEKRSGLRAPYTEGLSITKLTIENGTALVSLASECAECPRWPGDLAVWRFKEAISRTLKQFMTVRRVVVCLDGFLDFEETRDHRIKKCD